MNKIHHNRAIDINKLVDKVTQNVFYTRGFAERKIITDWRYIVGEVLYKKTVPQKIIFPKGKKNEGILYIQSAIGWATEIQHLEPIIIEKISSYFGYRAVKKISIMQAPVYNNKQTKVKVNKPISQEDKTTLLNMVGKVSDDELKQKLTKLGESVITSNS